MSDDLISRQAVLDMAYPYGVSGDGPEGFYVEVEDILSLPSAQSEQQWIPVKKQLPEEERKHYWVCTDSGYQCECRWINNIYGLGESDNWGWSIVDVPQYSKVVAWMPLPAPYVERSEDEEV